ncbi:MAG: hypothetical protein JW850_00315 [Thermoflexales bacterium]|nr:hypothetical protein [Thermoflexales bacterium]
MSRMVLVFLHAWLLLGLLSACAPAAPTPTLAPTQVPTLPPTATLVPTPTPIPTPTPTATPIPPLVLNVHWPKQVSALQPPLIQAGLVPPPGISLTVALSATVLDPEGFIYQSFELSPRGGNRYTASQPLHLSLWAVAGDWRLVVNVETRGPHPHDGREISVEGQREFVFRLAPVLFRVFTDTLHAGVDLRVPQAFEEVASQGNPWAGMRAWRHGDGELSLWWAPGPTEPLQYHNAVVIREATCDPDRPPRVLGVQPIWWQGRAAFLFSEDWGKNQPGSAPIPAETLVVQGDDFWLHVLRVRALEGAAIPPLVREVWESFGFSR